MHGYHCISHLLQSALISPRACKGTYERQCASHELSRRDDISSLTEYEWGVSFGTRCDLLSSASCNWGICVFLSFFCRSGELLSLSRRLVFALQPQRDSHPGPGALWGYEWRRNYCGCTLLRRGRRRASKRGSV